MFIYFQKSFKKDLQVDMVEDGRTMSDLKRVLPQCFVRLCMTLPLFALFFSECLTLVNASN